MEAGGWGGGDVTPGCVTGVCDPGVDCVLQRRRWRRGACVTSRCGLCVTETPVEAGGMRDQQVWTVCYRDAGGGGGAGVDCVLQRRRWRRGACVTSRCGLCVTETPVEAGGMRDQQVWTVCYRDAGGGGVYVTGVCDRGVWTVCYRDAGGGGGHA